MSTLIQRHRAELDRMDKESADTADKHKATVARLERQLEESGEREMAQRRTVSEQEIEIERLNSQMQGVRAELQRVQEGTLPSDVSCVTLRASIRFRFTSIRFDSIRFAGPSLGRDKHMHHSGGMNLASTISDNILWDVRCKHMCCAATARVHHASSPPPSLPCSVLYVSSTTHPWRFHTDGKWSLG